MGEGAVEPEQQHRVLGRREPHQRRAHAREEGAVHRRRREHAAPRPVLVLGAALPSPATHAILTDLKAGESVFQILLLTKTVVHAYGGAQPLFHALFWRQNTV